MATIPVTAVNLDGISSLAKSYLWTSLIAGSLVGARANVAEAGVSLTFQAIGATFASATLTLRGSNKPDPDVTVAADWFTLKQTDGTDATLTEAGGLSVSDLPLWVCPIIAGGGGTEDVTVRLVVR